MSTSDHNEKSNDFDGWIKGEFNAGEAFTALSVLVEIADARVTPLCSTYFNVIGDEVGWDEITVLFAGAGRDWDGAAFFPLRSPHGGPVDNPTARLELRRLESRLDEDRLVLNEGHFFDRRGRRLKIEEVS